MPEEAKSAAQDEALPGSRRAFLAYLSGILSLAIAAVLAVPLIGFVLAPLFKRRTSRWVKLGRVDEVTPGVPTRLTYLHPGRNGWQSAVAHGAVYATTDDGSSFTVLSNVCSHANCGVQWDPRRRVFQCPCHDGRFDREGKAIHGPPAEPLTRFAHKVENGFLFIQLEDV